MTDETTRRARLCALALALGAAALVPAAAGAQTADPWQFTASIYAYFPSVGGSTRFPASGGGSSVGVDSDKLMDHLQSAFMGSFEAMRGQWGLYTDVMYVDFGNSRSGTQSIDIGGVLPVGASASTDYNIKGSIWTLTGLYRAVSTPRYKLDVVAGTRVLDVHQRLSWSLSGNVGQVALVDRAGSRETGVQNWDAIVGVKGRARLGDASHWFMPYYVDLGTGESKFTWQVMAGVGYAFGWGDVVGTWRYVDYQMKSGHNIENLNFNGPAVAAVFHW